MEDVPIVDSKGVEQPPALDVNLVLIFSTIFSSSLTFRPNKNFVLVYYVLRFILKIDKNGFYGTALKNAKR